jgi:hypothetical protein
MKVLGGFAAARRVPWAAGKMQTHALAWFLASWAKVLSWREVAKRFHSTWDTPTPGASGERLRGPNVDDAARIVATRGPHSSLPANAPSSQAGVAP